MGDRCLDENTLAELADASLSPDDCARVEQHLDLCTSCRVLFAAVARAIAKRASRPPPEPRTNQRMPNSLSRR
jgi:predicted anti-sigma-YlaC factor YlaD